MGKNLLAWAQKNERHLGAAVFFFGFVTDLVALALLDVSFVIALFSTYLALVALFVLLGHALSSWRDAKPVWKRGVLVILPLVSQYLLGNLLSWFLIFYAKSSVLEASWPFLVLLAAVFVGNEWFRKYKDRLAFIAVLLFFALYAYAIFALPLLVGRIGPWVFLGSTALSIAAFGLFLYLLWKTGKERLLPGLAPILGSSLAIVVVMVASYFTGLIPPIPLTLKEGGIYHGVRRDAGDYVLLAEEGRPWFDPRPPELHTAPGAPLYAFSAVSAPMRFSAGVVHHWQRYDEGSRTWVTEGRVAYPMAGGRTEGYRGYSERASLAPGRWRVRVETPSGQVIGQLAFTVVRTDVPPATWEERH